MVVPAGDGASELNARPAAAWLPAGRPWVLRGSGRSSELPSREREASEATSPSELELEPQLGEFVLTASWTDEADDGDTGATGLEDRSRCNDNGHNSCRRA